MMSQPPRRFRQKAAQTGGPRIASLADAARWGTVVPVDGKPVLTSLTDKPYTSPYLIGRACVYCTGLPDFSCFARALQKRRGSAQPRIVVRNCLRHRPCAGFVASSVKSKKQGWAGCEHQRSSPQLRCARALRPAEKQPANRPFMARGRACLAHSSLMATRSWGLSPGRLLTCFIARQARASAADFPAGQNLKYNRSFAGPNRHMQRAIAGLPACGGVLLLQNPKLKDTQCSTRS